MRVFAPSATTKSSDVKMQHTKNELRRISEELRSKIKERNEVVDELNRVREEQEDKLLAQIGPLVEKRNALELEVSNLEARRRNALAPTLETKRRVAAQQREMLDMADALEYKELDLEQKEQYLAYKEKRIADVDKDIRNKRIWVKREIKAIEKKSAEITEHHEKTAKALKEAEYREKVAKELEERVLKYKKQVDEDQRAYRAMLDEQKVRLDRESAKIASDRAKLKVAQEYASKGCKQCKTSDGSKSPNRRSKTGKNR
jgi:DNA repair exonuclease SbcCD ATPase subunit